MNTLKVKDEYGQTVTGWRFGYTQAVHLCAGQKPRHVKGWSLIAPDGYERFSEGNWQQFVPFALQVISNYGCKTTLS